MTDPALPGSTVGDADGFPIWVPSEQTPLIPLRAWFVMQANSVIDQLKQLQTRQRSQVLLTDVLTPGSNWSIALQKLTIYGETWAYFQATFTRTNKDLVIDSDGQFANETVANMPAYLTPSREAGLASAGTGRVFTGQILDAGQVQLVAAGNGYNLPKGSSVSLTGAYPLQDYYDSLQGA